MTMPTSDLICRALLFVVEFDKWQRRDPDCWTEAQLNAEAREIVAAIHAKPIKETSDEPVIKA